MKVEIRIVDEGGGFVIGLVQQHGERPRHYVVEDAAGNLGVAKKAGGSRGTQFVMGGKDGGLWVPTTVDGREWYDNHDGGWNTLGLGDALRVAYVSEVDEENIRDRRRDRFWDPAHNILM